MFFQDADAEAAGKKAAKVQDFSALSTEINNAIKSISSFNGVLSATFDLFERLIIQSEELNKTFVGGRLRMQEISKAINDAAPDVVRLGGSFEDVGKTLGEIAAGTRTQIVASTKDVRELFAAGEVLDQSVLSLVDSFDKVGIAYSDIAENLTDSILYVQSVGQNARSVMKDVVANTEQLSRFNFENGVQGLTKMAAQASMLRFDMKSTFDFAERVLDPDKAIEMSSAFQRLGVAVGSLGDPLSLLNQSLTDPSGLQESLINMTKQFTYFDEKSKSFRVSPQGILTMRELADVTGISAGELRKTALAAAEMDSKLAKINTTGLNFEVSDENKMLIANVARMGEGGEYEVSIKDERGYEYQKKLTELQEQDFQRLIEQQSKAPKTIEEIQQSQLNTAEKMLFELRGIKETFASAYFGLPGVQETLEGKTNLTRDLSELMQTAIRDTGFKTTLSDLSRKAQEIRDKGLKPEEEKKQIQSLFDDAKGKVLELVPSIFKTAGVRMSDIASEQNEQVKAFTDTVGNYFKSLFPETAGEIKPPGYQMPNLGTKAGTDYGILSTSYNNPALTTLMSKAATGNVASGNVININNPAISYSPTIQPQMKGVNSPQELMDLINRGGVQLTEDMAKNLYESIRKLDLVRMTP